MMKNEKGRRRHKLCKRIVFKISKLHYIIASLVALLGAKLNQKIVEGIILEKIKLPYSLFHFCHLHNTIIGYYFFSKTQESCASIY